MPRCEGRAMARGWCKKHYNRWHRHGSPWIVKRVIMARTCIYTGCDEPPIAKGFCNRHYQTIKQPRWLPAGPLQHVVERLLMERGWAYVETLLGSGQGLKRLREESFVRWDAADRATVALGLHPAMLWPDLWIAFRDPGTKTRPAEVAA